MKIKEKLLISAIGIASILLIVNPIKSSAALQANGKWIKGDVIDNWILNIRKMEETGGTLGLTDRINTTNLSSTASESNNLDIHLQKNTEFGAMAILSASSYGNQNKILPGDGIIRSKSTTGNMSGVFQTIRGEIVSAAHNENLFSATFTNANSKYKNIYNVTSDVIHDTKLGDAMDETKGWHSSSGDMWVYSDRHYGVFYGFVRGYNNTNDSTTSIFSFHKTTATIPFAARAVLVIGNGF